MNIEQLVGPHIRRIKSLDGTVVGINLYFRGEKEMNKFLREVGKAYCKEK